jgi:hypothetical protein
MQMSRSVSIPTNHPASFNTGTHPQSLSHMTCATVARLSELKHALTFEVITSLTFIALHPVLTGLASLDTGL